MNGLLENCQSVHTNKQQKAIILYGDTHTFKLKRCRLHSAIAASPVP